MQNSGSPSNSLPVPEGFGKSGLSLTDAEVICSWMEARPGPNTIHILRGADWWLWWGGEWTPIDLGLDQLHEVEARLSDEQWDAYEESFDRVILWGMKRSLLHADAPAKIRALAATLRSRVLPKDDVEGAQACQKKRGQESKL